MRRALLCVAACSCALAIDVAAAQVRSFPYEAVVETDGTPVHSGPGFYATTRLKKGEHIVVQRHDPGGWYMITPPTGEFSLVKTSSLRDTGGGNAEIVAAEASARVGSRVGQDFGVEQIPLVQGDRVKLMSGVSVPAGWTAIQPPRGEYRWISGRFVVPVLPNARVEHDTDPYAVPSLAKRPDSFEEAYADYESYKPVRRSEGPALALDASVAEPAAKESETAAVLRNLDRELEGLTLSEPTEWPLEKLTAGYEQLKAGSPSLGRQIDVRLAQIAKMRLVKSHYNDYVQLTSATDERDSLLLASDERTPARMVAIPPANAPATMAAAPPRNLSVPPDATLNRVPMAPPAEPARPMSGPVLGRPEIAAVPPVAEASPVQRQPAMPVRTSGPPQAPASTAPQPQRFEAVGIVRKAVNPQPEGPQYVLVSPKGQILVHLQEPDGVSFEGFVGAAMGVDGKRQQNPASSTPMIAVEKLTPVRF